MVFSLSSGGRMVVAVTVVVHNLWSIPAPPQRRNSSPPWGSSSPPALCCTPAQAQYLVEVVDLVRSLAVVGEVMVFSRFCGAVVVTVTVVVHTLWNTPALWGNSSPPVPCCTPALAQYSVEVVELVKSLAVVGEVMVFSLSYGGMVVAVTVVVHNLWNILAPPQRCNSSLPWGSSSPPAALLVVTVTVVVHNLWSTPAPPRRNSSPPWGSSSPPAVWCTPAQSGKVVGEVVVTVTV